MSSFVPGVIPLSFMRRQESIRLFRIRYFLDGFTPSGTSGLVKPGMTWVEAG